MKTKRIIKSIAVVLFALATIAEAKAQETTKTQTPSSLVNLKRGLIPTPTQCRAYTHPTKRVRVNINTDFSKLTDAQKKALKKRGIESADDLDFAKKARAHRKNKRYVRSILAVIDSYSKMYTEHKDALAKIGIKSEVDFDNYKVDRLLLNSRHLRTDFNKLSQRSKEKFAKVGVNDAKTFDAKKADLKKAIQNLNAWRKLPNKNFSNLPEGHYKNSLMANGVTDDFLLSKYIAYNKRVKLARKKIIKEMIAKGCMKPRKERSRRGGFKRKGSEKQTLKLKVKAPEGVVPQQVQTNSAL